MKKIFAMAAMAVCALSANAAVDFSYTADPQAGSTVTELTTIEVIFDNCAEIEFANKSGITLTNGDAAVDAAFSIAYATNSLKVVCASRQTAAGVYTLTIPAGSITGYDENYNSKDNSLITMNWTIEAAEAGKFEYTVTPGAGKISELREIVLTFPKWQGGMMDVPSASAVSLTRDNTPVAVNIDCPYDAPEVRITPTAVQTAAGTYRLEIPAGAIDGFTDEDYASSDMPIAIEWIIEGNGNELKFDFDSTPADGSVSEEISEISLTFIGLDQVKCSNAEIALDGVKFDASAYTLNAVGNKLTFTLDQPVTDGKITLSIPAGAIDGGLDNTYANNPDAILLTVFAAQPVVYDLTATISSPKPNADGEISADRQIDAWIFACDVKDIIVDPNATADNITIKEDNGDWERSASLVKGFGLGMNKSFFMANIGAPRNNGTYTITISKGAFGNEAWVADHDFGRSNDEIVLHFTFVDGLDGVDSIVADNGEARYFTLQGMEVAQPEDGIYIRVANGKATKVIIRK